jgi:hypothetical protein
MGTGRKNSWRLTAAQLVVTGGALVAAAFHLMQPTAKIDGVLLGLLAVAAAPWLGSFLESVEGAGWKVTYRRLERELENTREELQVTKGEVASATHRADFIESQGVAGLATSSPAEEMGQLVSEYNRIRREMKSGPARTRKMTDVVRHLTLLADRLDTVDWPGYLHSQDGGERIAAYAYYYARPDPRAARELTRVLTNVENTPFGQYWAIQALGKIAEAAPASVLDLVPDWQVFLDSTLRPGTDRYYVLSQLISSLSPARR